MFEVTNEEQRGMHLKSWSVLGFNTKDKKKTMINLDTNSLVATQDMILSWEQLQFKE
jgi:hypothetical protein